MRNLRLGGALLLIPVPFADIFASPCASHEVRHRTIPRTKSEGLLYWLYLPEWLAAAHPYQTKTILSGTLRVEKHCHWILLLVNRTRVIELQYDVF
jgi:hypothetical protein